MDHPKCEKCNVPMWLVHVHVGEVAHQQQFECMVCEAVVRRTVEAKAA